MAAALSFPLLDYARLRAVLAGPRWGSLANAFVFGLGAALVLSAILNFLVPDAFLRPWLAVVAVPIAMLISLSGYGLVSNWLVLLPQVFVILGATACTAGPGAYCMPPTAGELVVVSAPVAILLGTIGHLLGSAVTWRYGELSTSA